MKKEFKIVICGGGSTYTAGIVKNLLEEEELKIKELWLYDIDQERQEKVSLIVKEVVKDLRPSLELKIRVKFMRSRQTLSLKTSLKRMIPIPAIMLY